MQLVKETISPNIRGIIQGVAWTATAFETAKPKAEHPSHKRFTAR